MGWGVHLACRGGSSARERMAPLRRARWGRRRRVGSILLIARASREIAGEAAQSVTA